jgi:hypothetical protein
MNIKGVCMYHQKDFDSLPEDMRQTIIDHHQTAIRIWITKKEYKLEFLRQYQDVKSFITLTQVSIPC